MVVRDDEEFTPGLDLSAKDSSASTSSDQVVFPPFTLSKKEPIIGSSVEVPAVEKAAPEPEPTALENLRRRSRMSMRRASLQMDGAYRRRSSVSQGGGCPFSGGGAVSQGGGCPFSGGARGHSRVSSIYLPDVANSFETDPDEEMAMMEQLSCPVVSANAAQRNAELMKTMMQSNNNEIFEFEENERGEDGSPTRTVNYSYTRQNVEFPHEITEEELFEHGEKHTYDGYFSRKYGFLVPDYERALKALLQGRGRIWYTMGRRMIGMLANNTLVQAIDDMEIVEGDASNCPDESLQVTCSILGQLMLGYRASCFRNHNKFEAPPSLQVPWTMICKRLGRKDVYYSAEDHIYNCRPLRGDSYEIDNLEVTTKVWQSNAESVMLKMFCASNVPFKNMLSSILALARNEWKAEHLYNMIREIANLTKMMGKAIPDGSAGENSIDPVEFATAFANANSPLKEGVPGVSGGGCPIFVCLDHVIGRKMWKSTMGADLLMQTQWMPKNWRRFIEFLRQKRIFENVPDNLQYLWLQLKDVYVGERGWLGRHKYRAYQFVELSGALGRASNKGASHGEGALRMLEESRGERDPAFSSDRSSYKTCLFKGKITSVNRVSDDRLTKMVTIQSSRPLFFNLGDHVAIVMKNSDDRIWSFSVEHNLTLQSELTPEDGTLTSKWKERLDFDRLSHTVYNVLLCAKLAGYEGQGLTVDNLCANLHPEEPRLYSYATINRHNGEDKNPFSTTFDLLVTKTGPGGCSSFLFDSTGSEVSFGLSTASKFDIPEDDTRPLVVLAAGSGLGTYLPLLINDQVINPRYAFLAFRSEDTVPYIESHFKKAVALNRLNLFVELSREEKTLVTSKRKILTRTTQKRYIDKLLLEQAKLIRELAAPIDDGGMGANFYVCGNNAFFSTVRDSLEQIQPGMVSGLVECNRLHLEVQARGGVDGKTTSRPISLAEMCFHNKLGDFWTAIHGKVYDFTTYLPWHPGGRKILHYIAGTDCTARWDLASHSQDRMVYSQLSAYEIGPYKRSSSPMEDFLEHITRTENCINLYKVEDDLFDNLCDSYGKVQQMLESVFDTEFLELSFQLSDAIRQRVLHRIWYVKHGRERDIAGRMYKVAPMKGSKELGSLLSESSRDTLRHATREERDKLKTRLSKVSDYFFYTCKKAIADYVSSPSNVSDTNLFSKTFYRLVMAFEQMYSSLAQPLPLDTLRLWDVVRSEVLQRKTFNLRFPEESERIDESFTRLTAFNPCECERKQYVEALLEHLMNEPVLGFRQDHGKSTNIVNDWFTNEDKLALFRKLDTDNDGLITVDDLNQVDPLLLKKGDRDFISSFRDSEVFQDRETFSFVEFLEGDPEVALRNKLQRVSSLLFLQ